MTLSIRHRVIGLAAAAAAFSLTLAGCAAPPSDTATTGGGATGSAVEGFLPCMVSDAGGFDDKSFNQLGLNGLQEAAQDLGVDEIHVESDSEDEYAPNIDQLVQQNCTMIITVGFALSAATIAAAEANPDIDFVIIDDAADADFDGETDAPNIKPIIFDTAQAAFLAGYAAASYSTTKTVGTFGGAPYPTVTIFMDGFLQGVNYWNSQKGDSVAVVGWNGTDGVFTGAFDANQDAINAAQGLVDQNADVILPVGGPIYQSAASVIEDSGKDIALIGVDADVYETDPSVASLLLTSIRKLIDVGVSDAVTAAGNDDFDATPFIGTLDNGGVGIAPFHDFESKVSPDLQGELDDITAGIIDGSIPVTSYLNP